MTAALAWAICAALLLAVLRLRRRLELVAQAAHELRGPTAAFGFAVAALRREPHGVRRALPFESELERMRAGLADLDAARMGRRPPLRERTIPLEHALRTAAAGWRPPTGMEGREIAVRWDAGHAWVRADRGRLSQALGNVMANAVQHGSGPIEVTAVRKGPRTVRVEVRNATDVRRARRGSGRARGRGLVIASRAVHEIGGKLTVERRDGATTAAVELPVDEGSR